MRARRPLSVLVATLAAATGIAAAAEAKGRTQLIGTQALALRGATDQATIDRRFAAVRRMGLRAVRVEVTWSAFEPQASGRIEPEMVASLDRVTAAARRFRLKVVPIVLDTPCWASSAPADVRGDCTDPARANDASQYPPTDPDAYARFTSWVVERQRSVLAGVVLWNEPDHRNEIYWRGPDKIARYVALVKATYGPLKRVAPEVPVLAGAFVGGDGRWLTALYAAGIKGHYDALALHFYDLTFFALRRTRAIMLRHGDRSPAWLGETGWTSCRYRARDQDGHLCVDAGSQARFTGDLLRGIRRARWVRGVLLYTLQDAPTDDFGLLDRSGREKPVARTLRRELGRRRPARPRRLTLRAGVRRGVLRVRGSGPAGDVWSLRATTSRATYRSFLRMDQRGRYDVALPAALGRRNVRIELRSAWYGQRRSVRVR